MRITANTLERSINLINKELGLNPEPYSDITNGITGNKGTLKLDCAYGGYKVVEMIGNGTGEREITRTRMTSKELYNFLDGFVVGMKAQRDVLETHV